MGILSFFICITAPVAWVLGRSLHKDCAKAGVAVPSRAAVGMWFGIVLSVILIIYLVCIMIAMMAQL